MAASHRFETEIINPRGDADALKTYFDQNHKKGWELVNYIPQFDRVVVVWKKPTREQRG